MKASNKKGQGTLEYTVLVTGAVVTALVFLKPQGGVFATAVNKTLATGTNGMEEIVIQLDESHTTPDPVAATPARRVRPGGGRTGSRPQPEPGRPQPQPGRPQPQPGR